MGQERVLIVDDDVIVLHALKKLLEGQGYEVLLAKDGVPALDLAAVERPDLIILDLLLPELDGFEVTKRLRQNPVTQSIPIIVASALRSTQTDSTYTVQMGSNSFTVQCEGFVSKPIAPDALLRAVREALASSKAIEHLPRERILVVDDDPLSMTLLRRSLENAGYTVTTAEDGSAGLKAIVNERPDLVLLDYHMPNMDGLQVLEQVRRRFPLISFVFMTAYGSEDVAVQALRLGADDYLVKPFRPWGVAAVVEENLEKSRQRRLTRSLTNELNYSNQQLRAQQQELSARNTALQQAYSQLQQVDEIREDLLSMIVHDLKNPLGIVMGALELLAEDFGPTMNREQRELAASGRRAGSQLTTMVSNLLDIQRLEAGKMPLLLGTVDIGELIQQAVSLLQHGARNRRHVLRVEIAPDLPAIRADGTVLSRMLSNLLENAVKFTPAGGSITVRAQRRGHELIVGVEDTGAGVPVSHRERIFDKFEQLNDTPGVRRGSGLGLTFCKLAAEAHGGRIWVEDNRPQGSCFRFAVPMLPVEGSERAP